MKSGAGWEQASAWEYTSRYFSMHRAIEIFLAWKNSSVSFDVCITKGLEMGVVFV